MAKNLFLNSDSRGNYLILLKCYHIYVVSDTKILTPYRWPAIFISIDTKIGESMRKLNGKIAVVTGGNSGIGYYSAKRLKKDGATVIITGRSEEKVNQAAAELGVTGFVAGYEKNWCLSK